MSENDYHENYKLNMQVYTVLKLVCYNIPVSKQYTLVLHVLHRCNVPDCDACVAVYLPFQIWPTIRACTFLVHINLYSY